MTFDRRDFLKLCGMSGLAVSVPTWPEWAQAAEPNLNNGPLWILVSASGGWDPTSHCDPKGRKNDLQPNPINKYMTGDIETAGNIAYAPSPGNKAFFNKWHKHLTVINGIDMQTNGHRSGQRHTWSGDLKDGGPALGALIAGTRDASLPMAFVSNGGYSTTAGLVALTRVGSPDALVEISRPNMVAANSKATFFSKATASRIAKARQARMQRLGNGLRLPTDQRALAMLELARLKQADLANIQSHLPNKIDTSNNPLKRQAQIGIASYKAGLTAAVNLAVGGFDTHSNHDAVHFNSLKRLFEGVTFAMEEAERQKVADNVIIVVGSDFGRTPHYNAGNGKDHWSVGSVLLMGKGVPGNRVIGYSNEQFRCGTVNPKTLKPDPYGIRIRPGHVHRSLRKLAGIEAHQALLKAPIKGDLLPLLKA
jgi:uncharacterized protein (DUF1501 family)